MCFESNSLPSDLIEKLGGVFGRLIQAFQTLGGAFCIERPVLHILRYRYRQVCEIHSQAFGSNLVSRLIKHSAERHFILFNHTSLM